MNLQRQILQNSNNIDDIQLKIKAIEFALTSFPDFQNNETNRREFLMANVSNIPGLKTYICFTFDDLMGEKRQLQEKERQLQDEKRQLQEKENLLQEKENLLLRQGLPCLGAGLPPLQKIITNSSGSIPPASEHQGCDCSETDFFLLGVPQNIQRASNRVWGQLTAGTKELQYSNESTLVTAVNIFLMDVINASGIALKVNNHLGIKSITPDISVLSLGNRLVGVVEVKQPGHSILLQPTVLGELFDQMLLVQGFYGSGPVIGILTTFDTWMFCCFERDNEMFGKCFGIVSDPSSCFATPEKSCKSDTDSPPGNTPSQKNNAAHSIAWEDSTFGELKSETSEVDRKLCCSPVINAQGQYPLVLQYLFTALHRMALVTSSTSPTQSSQCWFVLHEGNNPITWVSRAPSELIYDKFPRSNVRHLLALEDLGRGSTGKAWLTCTLSGSAVCVLKFLNKENGDSILQYEKMMWDLIYPEYRQFTGVGKWSGSVALMMPHFNDISPFERMEWIASIKNLLLQKFVNRGYYHPDVKWRNIGVSKTLGNAICPVLYDLTDVKMLADVSDVNLTNVIDGCPNWVNLAIEHLNKTAG